MVRPSVEAVILAAGKGTRMKSDLPKVLHRIAGRTLLDLVLDTVAEAGVARTVVVVGHQAALVQQTCRRAALTFVVQEPQMGTGHAVQVAAPSLTPGGLCLVLAGDVPLLRPGTLRRLVQGTAAGGAAATVLTCVVADAGAYGRIVKGPQGRVLRIVEARDATPQELRIGEYNTGVFCFRTDALLRVLGELTSHNSQGEYYLTDTVALLVERGLPVLAVATEDPGEAVGINTVQELAAAEAILYGRED